MRYLKILAAFVLAQLPSLPFPGATAATLSQHNVGNWTVGAFSDDSTGQFSYCAAWVTYNSNIALSFDIYSDYSWAVFFQNPQWKLTVNAQYPVTLTIDRNAAMNINATAVDTATVAVPLDDSEDLFNEFAHGDQLTLSTAGGANLPFLLTGTAKVLPKLLVCVRAHDAKAVAQSSNPFATPGSNTAPSQSPPPPQAPPQQAPPQQSPSLLAPPPQNPQAANAAPGPSIPAAPAVLGASPSTDPQAFAGVLLQAGVAEFTILSPEQTKKYNADVAWMATSNLMGLLSYVDPSAKATLQGLNAELIKGSTQVCSSKPVTSSPLDTTEPKALLTEITCTASNQSTYMYASILVESNGGFYILETFGSGQDPGAIDTKIRNIVYNTLEN